MSWIQSQIKLEAAGLSNYHPHSLISSSFSSPPLPYNDDYQKQPKPVSSSSSASKISPVVLFIIVLLAVIFFISGLLHLLVRFLMKHRSPSSISESNRYPEMSGHAYQRQLQQLFHLHDSGLDQAFIDALPVFLYEEIMGLKEPFDCAVCLCEFLEQDKLRLLPMCSHAFHIDCIDTWLMSNSTCPLCRGTIFTPGLPIENPVFDFEYPREEIMSSSNIGNGVSMGSKSSENDIGKRVFSVKLGKFTSSNDAIGREGEGGVSRGEGEPSSSNLDARRCYSMGSCQYVVADELQVALCPSRRGNVGTASMKLVKGRVGQNGNSSNEGDAEGKKINLTAKGESFSVSKIWQWSKKGKFPSSLDTIDSSSDTVGLP